MVLGEAAAFTAAGAHALFGYNRENFMYDRKQRQEMEFKVLEWRSTQAELWRDDVREVIGLTERKMDTYLIVNTLQLGMCVGLFSEGRLEPGTPPWLLHLYMLTLSAAFMYLLMSVWLAMHASIVASCSSVRLLTQFVRLPIPTWQQLEEMRTYGQSVESLEPQQLLRVPFVNRRNSAPSIVEAGKQPSRQGDGARRTQADPWGLEEHGTLRGLYELMEQPAEMRRHIVLAQRAAKQYQAFDAFARVAMSFGTNQLLNAISYYVLGYVAVQDGAPFPACCVVLVMMGIALGLVHLDFSLNAKEQLLSKLLLCVGPVLASVATFVWAVHAPGSETIVMSILPFTYAAHGLWLFFAIMTCGFQLQENGSVLPMRFRAVLYLDVFGWLPKSRQQDPQKATVDASGLPMLPQSLAHMVHSDVCSREPTLVSPEKLQEASDEESRPRVKFAPEGADTKGSASTRTAGTEEFAGVEASPLTTTPFLRDTPMTRLSATSSAVPLMSGVPRTPGPSGEHKEVPENVFTPTSYARAKAESHGEDDRVEIVTGHDKTDPGRLPAKVFRLATTMLIVLWAMGLAAPVGVFREFMTQPLTADVFVEEIGGAKKEARGVRTRSHAAEHPRMRGKRVSKAAVPAHTAENIPMMPEGEILQAEWPSHSGFVPHSLSCDPTGRHLVIADDLGVYSGRLAWMAAKEEPHTHRSAAKDVAAAARTLLESQASKEGIVVPAKQPRQVLGVKLERLAPCTALEGQALKDVSVVCTNTPPHQSCRVVVLHAHGRRLAQCPLPLDEGHHQAVVHKSKVKKEAGTPSKEAVKPMVTWTITSDWLHSSRSKNPEHVESFAVNSECLDSDDVAPSREVGCVVVGTTSGRIVQLRGAAHDRKRLVPERSMQQRERTVARGSLHVFSNGLVVALRRSSGTVEAFNGVMGTRVGTWRLPGGLDWQMLCGGGDSLFVLGKRDGRHNELHRFPVPDELKVDPVPTLATASRELLLAGRIHEV